MHVCARLKRLYFNVVEIIDILFIASRTNSSVRLVGIDYRNIHIIYTRTFFREPLRGETTGVLFSYFRWCCISYLHEPTLEYYYYNIYTRQLNAYHNDNNNNNLNISDLSIYHYFGGHTCKLLRPRMDKLVNCAQQRLFLWLPFSILYPAGAPREGDYHCTPRTIF